MMLYYFDQNSKKNKKQESCKLNKTILTLIQLSLAINTKIIQIVKPCEQIYIF